MTDVAVRDAALARCMSACHLLRWFTWIDCVFTAGFKGLNMWTLITASCRHVCNVLKEVKTECYSIYFSTWGVSAIYYSEICYYISVTDSLPQAEDLFVVVFDPWGGRVMRWWEALTDLTSESPWQNSMAFIMSNRERNVSLCLSKHAIFWLTF